MNTNMCFWINIYKWTWFLLFWDLINIDWLRPCLILILIWLSPIKQKWLAWSNPCVWYASILTNNVWLGTRKNTTSITLCRLFFSFSSPINQLLSQPLQIAIVFYFSTIFNRFCYMICFQLILLFGFGCFTFDWLIVKTDLGIICWFSILVWNPKFLLDLCLIMTNSGKRRSKKGWTYRKEIESTFPYII